MRIFMVTKLYHLLALIGFQVTSLCHLNFFLAPADRLTRFSDLFPLLIRLPDEFLILTNGAYNLRPRGRPLCRRLLKLVGTSDKRIQQLLDGDQ